MKNKIKALLLFYRVIAFVILVATFTLKVAAQTTPLSDSAKLAQLVTKIDSVEKKVDATKKQLDSAAKVLSVKDYVDPSSLDSAKSNPSKYIYSNAFIKNKCCITTVADCNTSSSNWRFWICILLLIAFLFAAFYYLVNSDICKDPAFDTNGLLKKETSNLSYSFSRTQLWWWTVIIVSCFIFIYADTGVLVPFNGTVVILLGLGIGTTILGRVIDRNQADRLPGTRMQDDVYKKSDFLTDILIDDNGISIHRFQSFVFNIVYGIAFLFSFINSVNNCHYPFIEFTEYQLTLLGISSSAYLVIKANSENTKATPAAKTDANAITSNTVEVTSNTDESPFKRDINNFQND
jgi:ABC-type multidrug transport system fused ATPase/permease subunit